jgi:hypothetical protein
MWMGPAMLAIGLIGIASFGNALQKHALDGGFPAASLIRIANNAVRVPLMASALVALSLFIVARGRRAGAPRVLVISAIAAELASFGFFQEWRYQSPPATAFDMPSGLRDLRERLWSGGGRWMPVSGIFGPTSVLPPDISSFWGVPSASKFGPLTPRRYSELIGMSGAGDLEGSWGAYDNRALDLAGVRYVSIPPARQYVGGAASPEFTAYTANLADGRRWRLERTVAGVQIYENLRALPRAWLARRAATLTPSQIADTIHTSRLPDNSLYDPRAVALVEEPVMVDARDAGGESQVHWLESGRSLVELETDSSTAALLVLGDQFYPGWIATVDGRAAAVLRTNDIQRGVAVPAGRHRVRFSFRPRSFLAGGAISAISVLALVIFAAMQAGARRVSSKLGAL